MYPIDKLGNPLKEGFYVGPARIGEQRKYSIYYISINAREEFRIEHFGGDTNNPELGKQLIPLFNIEGDSKIIKRRLDDYLRFVKPNQ